MMQEQFLRRWRESPQASLALYDEVGMPALCAKSRCLTGYLQYLLDQQANGEFEIITPREPEETRLPVVDPRPRARA